MDKESARDAEGQNMQSPGDWIGRYQKYLSEFVYGGIDGSVTTFAVVSGSAGAGLDSSVIIILGFANLIADGFSMSVGSYLSTKSEAENFEKLRSHQLRKIERNPKEQQATLRNIYREKGFRGNALTEVIEVISSDKNQWVDTLMKEEIGFMKKDKSPIAMGGVTFFSFLLVGLIPLIIYVIDYLVGPPLTYLFSSSVVMTSLAFVGIGFLKSLVNETSKLRSIGETLFLGLAAASLAYITGNFLDKLF